MTSSMISHESLIAPLSVPDKPSIEGSPQVLIQSERMPIVTTLRSPDLTLESQSSDTIYAVSDKNSETNSDNHQTLPFSGNVQSLHMDMNSSKILNSCMINSPLNSRVMSPPMLSESSSDSIQSTASIRGNALQSNYSCNNMKLHNEEDCFEEKSGISLQTKPEPSNQILLQEQNMTNLRDISTPSPPHVPFKVSENQIHSLQQKVISTENYFSESGVKINGYENQNPTIYYQNGYSTSGTQEQINNYPNFNSNVPYYANSIQGSTLYNQFPQQNGQFISSNQKIPSNMLFKQQKNLKNQKIQFPQMCMWQTQHQSQQQYPPYQYFRYSNPQMQAMNMSNYNIYGSYQQVAPMKGDFSSSYQLPSNMKSNAYQNGRISPIQYSSNLNMTPLSYSLPNQDQQQQILTTEDSNHISNSNNNMNDPNASNSFPLNHDSTMSSKMNLMMNNYSSSKPPPLSKSDISLAPSRNTKQKSKSLLKSTSVRSYHHHHQQHHQTPTTELVPPKPVYYNDKELGRYGIRCVCGKGSITIGCDTAGSNESDSSKKAKKSKKNRNKTTSELESSSSIDESNIDNVEKAESAIKNAPNSIKTTTLLVQCDICHFWLHGLCINIARVEPGESYICPFCQNKRIFCTKCGENMNYSDPLIKCNKCGFWVHKECEGLLFGVNPTDFICRNCGGLSEESQYNIPNVNFLTNPQQKSRNPIDITSLLNNNENQSNCDNEKNDDDEIDLDTFYDMQIPNNVVFTPNDDSDSRLQILEMIPDGVFKKMIIYDLNKSELEFRPTLEKYFHTFCTLLFDYSHEFWRIFKDVFGKLFNIDTEIILKSIDSLANHLIYMPTRFLSIKQALKIDDNESDCIFYESPKTKTALYTNSESITKYLEGLNMTRIEKQPKTTPLYCKKSDGRVYTTSSLDENAFIADIPGFLMHTDEVRVEEEGIPKTCFLVTDMDLVIDTRGTDFEYFSSRIRRGFHFNSVVKLVRIQGEIRLCLFAMKMKTLLSSEEKLKKGPAIHENEEIILPLDGTIPFPVKKIQWKDKKKHKKHNIDNDVVEDKIDKTKDLPKLNSSLDSIIEEDEIDESDVENETNNSKSSNHYLIMTRNQEKRKKAELKLEKKNREEQISKLSLLSSFYDDSVQAFPFILLDDDEAVEKYKSQMEMKASKLRNGKGKR